MISSGVISVFMGMLPAMKITEPYSPSARANASAKPGQQRRPHHRQDDAPEGLPAVRAQAGGRLFDFRVQILQHRLHGADDERQPDEGQRHQTPSRV